MVNAVPAALTTVAAVRSLSPSQAGRRVPVRLRGVVTTPSGWGASFFFQDRTAGIAVDPKHTMPTLRAGDSALGWFALSVSADRVTLIGQRELPKAKLFRMSELTGGGQDSQWVESTFGEVQSIWNSPTLVLNLDTGDGLVSVRVMDFSRGGYESLPDALVRVRGVCATVYNDRRQFVGIRVFVLSLGGIVVEKPG